MASWRKLLASMVADPAPKSYSYDAASSILRHLDFHLATPTGGSHRKWRRVIEDSAGKRTIIIGLVERGSGTLPPEYIKDLVQILRENNLLPTEV